MTKIISTWKPWNIGKPADVVSLAKKYGNEVAIKAVDGRILYGTNAWTRWTWGIDQFAFADLLKAAGLDVSIWVVPYFWDWAAEVDAIHKAIQEYNPKRVYLDIERFQRYGTWRGTNVDENGNIKNVGSFLRRLGRVPAKVYFQGPRRLNLHPEVQAEKFLSYKDLSNGKYIVDGVGAQFYPMGWTGAQSFVEQTALDLASQENVLQRVGRPNLPHCPTLPVFTERGWTPTGEELRAQTDYLVQTLGDRLEGFNFWTLDFQDQMEDTFQEIEAIADPQSGSGPGPNPPDLGEWVEDAEAFRRVVLDDVELIENYTEEIKAADPGPAPGM